MYSCIDKKSPLNCMDFCEFAQLARYGLIIQIVLLQPQRSTNIEFWFMRHFIENNWIIFRLRFFRLKKHVFLYRLRSISNVNESKEMRTILIVLRQNLSDFDVNSMQNISFRFCVWLYRWRKRLRFFWLKYSLKSFLKRWSNFRHFSSNLTVNLFERLDRHTKIICNHRI